MTQKLYHIFQVFNYKGGELASTYNLSYEKYCVQIAITLIKDHEDALCDIETLEMLKSLKEGDLSFGQYAMYASEGYECFELYTTSADSPGIELYWDTSDNMSSVLSTYEPNDKESFII